MFEAKICAYLIFHADSEDLTENEKVKILHTRMGDGLIGEVLSTLQLTGAAFGTEEPEPC